MLKCYCSLREWCKPNKFMLIQDGVNTTLFTRNKLCFPTSNVTWYWRKTKEKSMRKTTFEVCTCCIGCCKEPKEEKQWSDQSMCLAIYGGSEKWFNHYVSSNFTWCPQANAPGQNLWLSTSRSKPWAKTTLITN